MNASDSAARLQCEHAARCGGCALAHLDYGAQLALKAASAARELSRYPALRATSIGSVEAAQPVTAYRSRAKLVVDGRHVGLFARGTHEVVDIPGCRAASEPVLRAVAAVRRALPFAFRLLGLDVREVDAGALVTLIVPEHVDAERLRAAARALVRNEPGVVSVSVSRRSERSPRLLGRTPETLIGPDLAPHQLAPGRPYQLAAPGSFVQAHPGQAARLYAAVEDAVSERLGPLSGKPILELFAGSGALALALAAHGARVTAIDSHEPGIGALLRAAREQQLVVEARAAKAEQVLARSASRYDAVIVDPPRRGLAPELRRALAEHAPRVIVYVSCEPATLARDLSELAEHGYRAARIVPFDLMPFSNSVELLAVLEPAPLPAPNVRYRDGDLLVVDTVSGSADLLPRVRGLPGFEAAVPVGPSQASGLRLFVRCRRVADELGAELCRAASERRVLARGVTRNAGRIGEHRYRRARVVGTHSLLAVHGPFGHDGARELARIGHPVLGEPGSDAASNRHFVERHGLDRAFVHVSRLELPRAGEALVSPLAPDLEAVLDSLARTPRAGGSVEADVAAPRGE